MPDDKPLFSPAELRGLKWMLRIFLWMVTAAISLFVGLVILQVLLGPE